MAKRPLDFPLTAQQSPQTSSPPDNLWASNIKIALCLSGGGYRAASFHLGTLAYLHRIKLLPNLDRLSTVSGGTFTGAKYILSLVEKCPFSHFFKDFYTFLKGTNLVEEGLKNLSQGEVQVPSGERKLINSLANVYAKTFLADSNHQAYTFGQILDADHIGVTEVSFNATEFRTGIAFRFQKTFSEEAKIGNYYVSISREDASKIRVADIVAASSCFPGGFEPIAFPQDFWWPNKKVPTTVTDAMVIPPKQQPKYKCDSNDDVPKNAVIEKTLALMDGGIYDNQGIDSLLLADERQNDGIPDLIIISDTDPTDENLFPYPADDLALVPDWLNLEHVSWMIYGFLVACVITVLSLAGGIWREIIRGTFGIGKDFFSALMPLLLSILVTAIILYGRRLIFKLLKRIPNFGIRSWQEIKTLKLNQFVYLLLLRVESLYALIGKVFMKRIRSLIFAQVYNDENYSEKRITNRIDRLLTRSIDDVPGIAGLEKRLHTVVKNAACMPTTLWFDNEKFITIKTASGEHKKIKELDALVIAGQATICFNLLQYITRVYGENPSTYPGKINELWNDLKQDWQQLNDNPCLFLDELKPSA